MSEDKRYDWREFAKNAQNFDVSKVPCARTAYATGLSAAAIIGTLRFTSTRRLVYVNACETREGEKWTIARLGISVWTAVAVQDRQPPPAPVGILFSHFLFCYGFSLRSIDLYPFFHSRSRSLYSFFRFLSTQTLSFLIFCFAFATSSLILFWCTCHFVWAFWGALYAQVSGSCGCRVFYFFRYWCSGSVSLPPATRNLQGASGRPGGARQTEAG